MKNASPEQKDTVMKSLAIAGFVAVIVVIAFLIVQIVSFLPSAFTSLASLADGIYRGDGTELVLVADETIANSGESFMIRWSAPADDGEYTFRYDCTDGVSVALATAADRRTVQCDTVYELGNVTEATLTIESERNRFTDVTYYIGFVPEGMDEALLENDDLVTIINANISPVPTAISTTTNETAEDASEEEEEETAVADDGDTEVADEESPAETEPEPTTPDPAPTVTEEFVYEIPISNPNGYTDLSVSFLGTGVFDGDNRFFPAITIDNDSRGAIQFAVKNIGTRTSEEWVFDAELPNGTVYESGAQAPLRPNERSIITLGFALEEESGVADFSVSIDTDRDTFAGNDSFSWAVEVVN